MRCERCKGYGKEVALGNIMVDCPECLGVGGVKDQSIGKLAVTTGDDLDKGIAPIGIAIKRKAKTKDSRKHGQGQTDKLQT